jgi:hypothetical protein
VRRGLDPTTAATGVDELDVLERVDSSPNLAIAFVFILSFALGLLLAFIGLRRAGVVPTWVLGAIVGAGQAGAGRGRPRLPRAPGVAHVRRGLGVVPALSGAETAGVGEHAAPAMPA